MLELLKKGFDIMAQIPVDPVYENTTMTAYYNSSNVLRAYFITAVEGYLLHDEQYDFIEIDEETGEPTGETMLGYIPYPAPVSVGYNYEFEANPRNIFAIPEGTVPENQIFNNGNSDNKTI